MSLEIRTPQALGDAIRRARKAHGLRLEDVALAAGTGIRFLSELERGKPTVRLDATLRVLESLGLSLTVDGDGLDGDT